MKKYKIINCLKSNYYKLPKHRRLANKKSLNSHGKLVIKRKLKNWLLGIEEDDQLPMEISCLCFSFDFSHKSVELSMSGFENIPNKIDKGSYAPLEAQFFFCELLNSFCNNKNNLNANGDLMQKVKDEIYQLFYDFLKSFEKQPEFAYLNKKKIMLGEFLHQRSKSFNFRCKID